MRKQYKKKRRSCALCKPHKRGICHRWEDNERQELEIWERIKRKIVDSGSVSQLAEEGV